MRRLKQFSNHKLFNIISRIINQGRSYDILLLTLRWGILLGVYLRFFVFHFDSLQPESYKFQVISAIWIFVLYTFFTTSVFIGLQLKLIISQKRSWIMVQILFEIALFSYLFSLTGTSNSDFYLFYALPLLISAEHLTRRFTLLSACLIISTYATILSIQFDPILLIRDLLPRMFFFLVIVTAALGRVNFLQKYSGEMEKRNNEFELLHNFVLNIVKEETLSKRLDNIVDAAQKLLQGDGGKIFLRSINNPNHLILESIIGLNKADIQKGNIFNLGNGLASEVISSNTPKIVNDYKNYPNRLRVFEEEIGSIIEVPFSLLKDIEGSIAVFSSQQNNRKFSEKDQEILLLLAEQAEFAIHNAKLLEREKSLGTAVSIMNANVSAVTTIVNTNISTENFAIGILKSLKNVVPYDSASVFEFQDKGGSGAYFEIIDCDGFKNRDDIIGQKFFIDEENPNRRVFQEKKIVHFDDITKEYEIFRERLYPGRENIIRSWLGIPLKIQDRIIGMISLDRKNVVRFNLEQQKIAETFAEPAAIALHNALTIRLKNKLIEYNNFLIESILRSRNIQETGEAILKDFKANSDFDSATLQLIEGDNRSIIATSGKIQIDSNLLKKVSSDPLIEKVIKARRPYIIQDVSKEPFWLPHPTTKEIKSWIGIPLFFDEILVGFITLHSKQEQAYSKLNTEALSSFVRRAEFFLGNQNLIDKLSNQIRQIKSARSLASVGLMYGLHLHRISNNLSNARGSIQLILKYMSVDNLKLIREINVIGKHIDSVLELIKEIRNTIDPIQPEIVDIEKVVQRVYESRVSSKDKRIFSFETRNVENVSTNIVGYMLRLEYVIDVIVDNSMKAIVKSKNPKIEVDYSIQRDNTEDFLLIKFIDNGEGIHSESSNEIFKLRSEKKNHTIHYKTGSGFGLALAKLIIETDGGKLTASSNGMNGTTVYLQIPIKVD